MTKFKGPQILLQAVKGLNCRCRLYGEGPLKEELQQFIDKNGLDAKIYPPVPYDQVPQLYADSDIIVFPSIWPEPFGRISIEAMAAGKPVIGSAVGGIKETIESGKGILVKPGDVGGLNGAIKDLILGENNNLKNHQNNILNISKYSSEKIIKNLKTIYDYSDT